jgi:hypothetical protein
VSVKLEFGAPVTNVCAGDINPRKRGYFVRRCKDYIECTDKKGKFWNVDPEVVFPGHLPDDECQRLFAPIWEKRFGNKQR